MATSLPHRTLAVVIPCLNDAALLHTCLASLAAQSVLPDEVIVVDNGSEDNSATVATQAGATVIFEPRRGITWATSAGFNAANSDVILRIDADVQLPPDFIERVHSTWDHAEQHKPRRVVGITGDGRFTIPGRKGQFFSRLYLGMYRNAVGLALGHHPLFGSNCSIRSDWWHDIRDTLNLADTFVHEDMQISFAVRPDETIWFQRDLVVTMDPRALHGFAQVMIRLRRGFHSIFSAWKKQPPHVRLAQRMAQETSTTG